MSRETVQSLLSELAELAGLDDLTLDDDGSCLLRLDQVLVHLEHRADDDLLCLFCPLGDAPEPRVVAIMAELLDANVLFSGTGNATLGIPAGTRLVTLQRLVSVEAMDLPAFQAVLEGLVSTAEHWLKRLEAHAATTAAERIPADLMPEHLPPSLRA